MDDEHNELSTDRIAALFRRKRQERAQDADVVATTDGRISSTADKSGFVQLNVKVRLICKSLVLEERIRRKCANHERQGMGEIVEDALVAYFSKTR